MDSCTELSVQNVSKEKLTRWLQRGLLHISLETLQLPLVAQLRKAKCEDPSVLPPAHDYQPFKANMRGLAVEMRIL